MKKPIARGNLYGIILVIAEGWKRLKFPHVDIEVPKIGKAVTISVAGPDAVDPGTLVVLEARWDSAKGDRKFYGRISTTGHWQPAHDCPEEVGEQLRKFAGNPVRTVAESGHLSGKCPFCRERLVEVGSQDAGYDELCAMSYAFPWKAESTFGKGMSGLQMKAVREAMGMDYVSFGEGVLGYSGPYKNVHRAVRRMEEKALLYHDAAEKVQSYYHRWIQERTERDHEFADAYAPLRQVLSLQ